MESATPRLKDAGSQIRGVDDSPYHRYSEFSFKKFNSQLSVSVTPQKSPHISDAESRRLPVSLSRRVGERFSNMNISENSKPKSELLEMKCKGPMTSENPVRFHVLLSENQGRSGRWHMLAIGLKPW